MDCFIKSSDDSPKYSTSKESFRKEYSRIQRVVSNTGGDHFGEGVVISGLISIARLTNSVTVNNVLIVGQLDLLK